MLWSAVRLIKEGTHTFIVRIRLETRELKNAEPIWRGMIEHVEIDQVEDEKSVYFDHLDKLSSYFAHYLQKIGVKLESLDESKRDNATDKVS